MMAVCRATLRNADNGSKVMPFAAAAVRIFLQAVAAVGLSFRIRPSSRARPIETNRFASGCRRCLARLA